MLFPPPALGERRHRRFADRRLALLRLAALGQSRIPKDRKERRASAIRERMAMDCIACAVMPTAAW